MAIAPAQQRSGQRALNIVLISITGLILDIFVIQPTAEPITVLGQNELNHDFASDQAAQRMSRKIHS